jgi:hypothetical protein
MYELQDPEQALYVRDRPDYAKEETQGAAGIGGGIKPDSGRRREELNGLYTGNRLSRNER